MVSFTTRGMDAGCRLGHLDSHPHGLSLHVVSPHSVIQIEYLSLMVGFQEEKAEATRLLEA